LQKSIIKDLKKVFIAIFRIIIIVELLINALIFLYRDNVQKYVNRSLENPVFIGEIFFVLPNVVILKDVFSKKSQYQFVEIPYVTGKVSFGDLFTKKSVSYSKITLHHLRLYDDFSFSFIQKQLKDIQSLSTRNKGSLVVSLNKLEGYIDYKDNLEVDFYLDSKIMFNNGFLSGEGQLKKGVSKAPYEFSFDGYFHKEQTIFKKIQVVRNNLDFLLWGTFEKDILKLNGYSLFNFLDEKEFNKINRLSYVDMHLLDLKSEFKLSSDKLIIKYFDFNLNNIPVHLVGDIQKSDQLVYNLNFTASSNQNTSLEKFKNISLVLEGSIDKPFSVDHGELSVAFHEEVGKEGFFDNWNMDFDNLLLLEKAHLVRGMVFKQINYSYDDKSKVVFDNVRLNYIKNQNNQRKIKVVSNFYGGEIEGDFYINKTDLGLMISSTFVLDNVQTKGLSKSFSKMACVDASLFSEMVFTNYPHYDLKGKINIEEGTLQKTVFFDWLSEYFSMPSLKDILFKEIGSDFTVNKNGLNFHNINLASKGINVLGDFHVDPNELVTSQFSLGFSRDILSESPHFNSLIKRKSYESYDIFDFDFLLSGNVDAMNFQWTQSVLKSKVQESLPNFYQKRIENGVRSSISN
jgi:hypothetical protein